MGYLGLLRPGNCALAFLGVLIGAIVELLFFYYLFSPTDYPPTFSHLNLFDRPGMSLFSLGGFPSGLEVYPFIPVLLAAVAAFIVTGAGNALNDFYDRTLDKTAHPERPLPSGEVTAKGAWYFALSLFGIGLVLALLVNFICFMIAIFNSYMLLTYEQNLKAKGVSGNAAVSYLTASVFLFGGASVLSFKFVPMLFLLGLLANMGREITKDIEDIEGDAKYRRTLPMTIGKEAASRTAIAYVVAAVAFSFLPLVVIIFIPLFFAKLMSYLVLVIVADAMFIYSCRFVMKNPKLAQTKMKYAMVVAMLAFLMIGLTPIPMSI